MYLSLNYSRLLNCIFCSRPAIFLEFALSVYLIEGRGFPRYGLLQAYPCHGEPWKVGFRFKSRGKSSRFLLLLNSPDHFFFSILNHSHTNVTSS